MRSESLRALRRFYTDLRDRLLLEKKFRGESVLLSCLQVKKNVRYRLLSDASIDKFGVASRELQDLLAGGFIRESAEMSRYSITAKGIWEIETEEGILSQRRLVDYLDLKNFDLFSKKSRLTSKEKVIVLSLLAARAFSESSCVDLKKDDATMNGWGRVIEKAYELLRALGLISNLEREKLLKTEGNEHPVSHLIRHTDALPRKTKGLYTAPGKQRYYLDLSDEREIPMDKVAFMFRLVFEGHLDLDGMDRVLKFCNKVAYDDAILVFELASHIFSNPSFDEVVKEGLRLSMVSRKYA